MTNCPFCNLDKTNICNTIIDETDEFFITPTKGSIVDGYILIIPKSHILSMSQLTSTQKDNLTQIKNKYREIFKKVYGRYPICFEHGSYSEDTKSSSSSIKHAHLHIVNHNFTNEQNIIKSLNMNKVSEHDFFKNKNKNYISYISPQNEYYITYNFNTKSQQMRIFIAEDLSIPTEYNWRNKNYDENIIKTINNLK